MSAVIIKIADWERANKLWSSWPRPCAGKVTHGFVNQDAKSAKIAELSPADRWMWVYGD